MTCQWCGTPSRSASCSLACRQARQDWEREEFIEDVELLIGTDLPENIATRLGYASYRRLKEKCHKVGRPDLAERLARELERYMKCA